MLENELYDWLKNSGMPVPEYCYFPLEAEPAPGFYPVALKIASPKVVHKTDMGGVALNLGNPEELRKAKQKILENLRSHGVEPGAGDGWITTRMYKGIELFFGILQDPVFEKVIVFGAGGVMVELFRDVCYIDSEAGEAEIEKAILRTKISAIFTKGFRGQKYSLRPVIDLILRLQRLDVQELDLNPVLLTEEGKLVIVDARVLPGKSSPGLRPARYEPGIFKPEKTVIVGVSGHAEKAGYALAKNSAGDPDCCYVNPHLAILFGKKIFSRLEDLPFVDTAVLSIPAASLQDTIERLIPRKVKNIIIITAGLKEAGKDERFLQELAERYQLNIIGPNCLGIYANGKNLSFGGEVRRGEINLFSQSGAILAELMDKAVYKNIGFENIVSVGNMADLDFADLIRSYTGPGPVNLYVEGITRGKNLLRAIRGCPCPVNLFKAGKTEAARKAAFSHTGNLSGNYELFAGLVQGAGARLLSDINGLLYPYHFKKVLVITNAGGAGTVISDLIGDKLYALSASEIDRLSEVLPSNWSRNNPIDIIGDALEDRYLQAMEVADGFGADAIYVLVTPQFMTNPEKIAGLFLRKTFRTKMFPVLLGGEMMEKAKTLLRQEKIVFFEELNEAVSFL
ncbi:MAG: acetate--CoA ligase family protein [Puia sp.]|nr:acetate--CoA ligase family protein [Puia sp.]